MSTFEVTVNIVNKIEPIEGRDFIVAAVIGEYRCVVAKSLDYKVGERVLYIPESAILPEWLITGMGLEGKLAGSAKNRVKPIKLGGCVSQGLVVRFSDLIKFEGVTPEIKSVIADNCDKEKFQFAEILGITKYVQQVPAHLAGEVANIGTNRTLYFDVENIKKYPMVLKNGELVTLTEKLHGTCCEIGIYISDNQEDSEMFTLDEDANMKAFVATKTMSKNGLAFKNNDANAKNLYVKNLIKNFADIKNLGHQYIEYLKTGEVTLYVLGEIFGPGVQDLNYGLSEPEFRIFAIAFKNHKNDEVCWLDYATMSSIIKAYTTITPVLLKGIIHYDYNTISEIAEENSETCEGKTQISEGVIATPLINRKSEDLSPYLTRIIMKFVSNNYLFRKNKNVSEFE